MRAITEEPLGVLVSAVVLEEVSVMERRRKIVWRRRFIFGIVLRSEDAVGGLLLADEADILVMV